MMTTTLRQIKINDRGNSIKLPTENSSAILILQNEMLSLDSSKFQVRRLQQEAKELREQKINFSHVTLNH